MPRMLIAIIRKIVGFCTHFPWLVIGVFLAGTAVSAYYAATHFEITTDINTLISPNLDWRQREATFEAEFPGHFSSTLVVIDAPTTELASAASAALTQKLAGEPKFFNSVEDLTGNEFFAKHGLLFQPAADVGRLTNGLGQASPFISTLVADPSLRGVTRILALSLVGVQQGQLKLDDMVRPLSMAAQTIETALSGRPAMFSCQELLKGQKPTVSELRRFIEVQPVLDYSELEPGKASSDAIRKAASDLDLASKYQARVRLTGSVPMADEEFSTVQQGAFVNAIGTVIIVLFILWMALKSARIIVAVFI